LLPGLTTGGEVVELGCWWSDARPAGVVRPQERGQPDSGGLLLSVAPGILGSLVADLCGRGVEPAVVGRVLAGPAGRIGVRRLRPAMSARLAAAGPRYPTTVWL
jgi:hypothetical protein